MGKNFVVADIDNNINHVYFYDERAQGKDADALCSLRLNYHLAKLLGNLHSNLPPAEHGAAKQLRDGSGRTAKTSPIG
ncbi:hypothetical protein F442_17514 [Phytophthora nicotianae P10297]|uniref:Uncharacterized protein n=1 Tax=Phytophthora nicotianae P10297 TaxID=1317064 RepID=W2YHI0_PHYNI|nr:hypothetical protein F442_17514 [Phytophthora nicotianae P10297]